MLDEWQTIMLVLIFKGKEDVSCEHAMNIVEKVLNRRIQELVHVDGMKFGFMPGRETTNALFVVRKVQKEYKDKKRKLYMCVCFLQQGFVLWDNVLKQRFESTMG